MTENDAELFDAYMKAILTGVMASDKHGNWSNPEAPLDFAAQMAITAVTKRNIYLQALDSALNTASFQQAALVPASYASPPPQQTQVQRGPNGFPVPPPTFSPIAQGSPQGGRFGGNAPPGFPQGMLGGPPPGFNSFGNPLPTQKQGGSNTTGPITVSYAAAPAECMVCSMPMAGPPAFPQSPCADGHNWPGKAAKNQPTIAQPNGQ